MAQDNGLPAGLSISGLAASVPRSTRLNTARQISTATNRVASKLRRQNGMGPVQAQNTAERVIRERMRMGTN